MNPLMNIVMNYNQDTEFIYVRCVTPDQNGIDFNHRKGLSLVDIDKNWISVFMNLTFYFKLLYYSSFKYFRKVIEVTIIDTV